MNDTKAVDAYSNAIFELGQELDILEELEDNLLYVKQVLLEHVELYPYLKSPVVTGEAKLDLLDKIFKSSINKMALQFLFVMVKRGRENSIIPTINQFVTDSRMARGIREVSVYVASPMSEERKTQLVEKLEQVLQGTVILDIKEDPSIMAGIIIQIGDTRIDASVARQLAELEKSLLVKNTRES